MIWLLLSVAVPVRKPLMKKASIIPTGFSLLELITVVVIISVLVGMGIPLYNKTVERVKDKEAQANLLLIKTAQEIYLAANGVYYPPGAGITFINDIDAINNNLRVNLNENLWDYYIQAWACCPPGFLAGAIRLTPNGGYNRVFSIGEDQAFPTCAGVCP